MNHNTSTTTVRTARTRPAERPRLTVTHDTPVAPLPRGLIYRTPGSPQDAADRTAVFAMTVEQRIDAMWAGRLTGTQLTAWSSRYPQQIPLLGGEFAYLVMHTPEFLEDPEPPTAHKAAEDNVIEFPHHEEVPRAAA